MNMYSIYTTYTKYMIIISIEVEPHQSMQMQIFPVHHRQQRRIVHTQGA